MITGKKVERGTQILAFKEERHEPKFTASQITSGVCPIVKIVKIGFLHVLGNSMNVPPLLWVSTDFPLRKHHHRTYIEALFLGAPGEMVCLRFRSRVGVKSRKNVFSNRLRVQN